MARRPLQDEVGHLVGVDLRAQRVHVVRHVALEVVEVPETPDEVDIDDLEVGAVAVQVMQREPRRVELPLLRQQQPAFLNRRLHQRAAQALDLDGRFAKHAGSAP